MITRKYLDDLTYKIIGAAIEVNRELGPGLLESIYHKCLWHELKLREINFESEKLVPVFYKGLQTETDLRCDFYIENCLVIEIKSVESMLPIHEAQLITYMKLLKAPKGILINFNSSNIFKNGQKTFVNKHFDELL
jgi:GxxExxY protein